MASIPQRLSGLSGLAEPARLRKLPEHQPPCTAPMPALRPLPRRTGLPWLGRSMGPALAVAACQRHLRAPLVGVDPTTEISRPSGAGPCPGRCHAPSAPSLAVGAFGHSFHSHALDPASIATTGVQPQRLAVSSTHSSPFHPSARASCVTASSGANAPIAVEAGSALGKHGECLCA